MRLFIVALLAVLPAVLPGADVAGDWGGTVKLGPQDLRLVLHVNEADGGKLAATFVSVDQGGTPIAVDRISLKEDRLHFAVDRIGASYSGKMAADGQSFDGTLQQGGVKMPLRLERIESGGAEFAPPSGLFRDGALAALVGEWSGVLNFGPQRLTLALRVAAEGEQYRVVADSPDQGTRGIPVTSVKVEGEQVEFSLTGLRAEFQGKFNEERTKVKGTFTQGGMAVPLVLAKAGPQ